ncbi:hypothetical protein EXW72_01545 [Pseudomonas sp. BCA14]|nr:hypothetical protein EXW70_02145 [Pseudomonas sp. JMN1]TFF15961.1 hypothetical protein EXW71_06895 [Pseudomonas sp. BCA17]TFF29897.1 hypothetical protein EXW73_06130 [Pseudomonas sp. BCA13]TFF30739.1 hypothetical protein EXW72_01545 [Pseudomonas sp. BCA14]
MSRRWWWGSGRWRRWQQTTCTPAEPLPWRGSLLPPGCEAALKNRSASHSSGSKLPRHTNHFAWDVLDQPASAALSIFWRRLSGRMSVQTSSM